MMYVEIAHIIANLLPLINNAETWEKSKKECADLPDLKTCYRWQDNGVAEFLRSANGPVQITAKADVWNRTYTVTLKSGSKEMSYSY